MKPTQLPITRTAFTIISSLLMMACSHSSSPESSALKDPAAQAKSSGPACDNLSTPSGRGFRYCTLKANPASNSMNLVYYFHGLGSSADELSNDFWSQAEEFMKLSLGSAAPDFVAVDYGESAIVGATGPMTKTASAQEFVASVIPQLDRILGYDKKVSRSVAGMSMGGFNALNVAAAGNFSSIILLCPALIDFDPFNSDELAQYEQRNASVVDTSIVNSAIGLAQATFGNEDGWNGSNPFAQLNAGKFRNSNIFISTGKQDQFGFFEGATAFQEQASAKGISVDWHPVNGRHCSFDSTSMIGFLKEKMR